MTEPPSEHSVLRSAPDRPPPDRPAPLPLRARGLARTFVGGDGSPLTVLAGVDLAVEEGEMVAVIGASGSGKSTLLHLLGGLDRPTAGEVEVNGISFSAASDDELSGLRNREIGFVFQFHHLLRGFSALDNVMMPALVAGRTRLEAVEAAMELLEEVGVSERASHLPGQLSGGEQQRVAVARALVNEPSLLIADEPSGNLDDESSRRLHALVSRAREGRRLAVVVATHNMELAARSNRVLTVSGGGLQPGERV